MPEFQLSTAVAFIIFNRPDTTERVFAEIARAKPPKLLVVADGARLDCAGEMENVAAARAVLQRVNWDCEVLTNFSDVNLGCKKRVSSGIDWVFGHVEEAIILEDDCLPHPTFFRFCQELLQRYRHDQRVSQIDGVNLQFGHRVNSDSYYFSRNCHIWGWATWRDRWQGCYDVDMKQWPAIRDEGRLADWFCSAAEQKHWNSIFEKLYCNEIDTWDHQWTFGCRLAGRLSVLPNVNLVSNIGFGSGATHTKGVSVLANMPVKEMCFPLEHPQGIFACQTLDSRFFNSFSRLSFRRRVRAGLRQLVRS